MNRAAFERLALALGDNPLGRGMVEELEALDVDKLAEARRDAAGAPRGVRARAVPGRAHRARERRSPVRGHPAARRGGGREASRSRRARPVAPLDRARGSQRGVRGPRADRDGHRVRAARHDRRQPRPAARRAATRGAPGRRRSFSALAERDGFSGQGDRVRRADAHLRARRREHLAGVPPRDRCRPGADAARRVRLRRHHEPQDGPRSRARARAGPRRGRARDRDAPARCRRRDGRAAAARGAIAARRRRQGARALVARLLAEGEVLGGACDSTAAVQVFAAAGGALQ